MNDHPISDEERVARAIAGAMPAYPNPPTARPIDLARAAIAALGPQLTAEEAKHMLTTYVFPPCSDCDAIRAKLSLIAQGEKP